MKKLLILLLALLLPACALGEADVMALQRLEGAMVYTASNGVDTVIRPAGQPFIGETELEDGELIAYLDYVDMPNENRVFLRLTVSIVTPEMYAADTMTLRTGKKAYTFSVWPEISEYDTIYYEDYAVCLTDESLPVLKDIISLKGKPVEVTLSGEGMEPIRGSVAMPADTVRRIRSDFEAAGGLKQDFGGFAETWPVEISK
ncbi:MAG: hypothetical protein IJ507_06610 [Clostridia bacterium]|nr:hypothetical protein [Clostridia bacterium]